MQRDHHTYTHTKGADNLNCIPNLSLLKIALPHKQKNSTRQSAHRNINFHNLHISTTWELNVRDTKRKSLINKILMNQPIKGAKQKLNSVIRPLPLARHQNKTGNQV